MATTASLCHGCRALSLQGTLLLVVAWPLAGLCCAAETPDASTADRLVREAMQAEIAGDAARHATLLEQAVRIAPNYSLARWQSGQIELDDDWQAIEEAQQAAAADKRQAEYRRLREQAGDSPAGQLALARWCRKNDLFDEARLHWASVLSVQPNHEEAQRALGVRWYDGRLMTYAQIRHAKEQKKAARTAARRWAPRIANWRRDIADELDVRMQSMNEIRAVRDVEAIPALEEATLDANLSNELQAVRSRQFSLAAVEALDAMPDVAASESLARLAVLAPQDAVRTAATDALKNRSQHDYIPLLLDSLVMPIESWFRVTTDADGSVHYRHTLYREGPTAAWSFRGSRTVSQVDFDGAEYLAAPNGQVVAGFKESDASVAAKIAVVAARSQQRFAATAEVIEQQVAGVNESAAQANERIIPVLEGATGQEFGDDPSRWWDWWKDENHYYEGETPVYETYDTDTEHHYYREPEVRVAGYNPHSCFAPGTPVWTKTGLRPIETLEIGDLVVAQDPDSGRLMYKPVIGRTIRHSQPTLMLRLGSEQIQATLGHLFWVPGSAWKMAENLQPGTVLHGVKGPVLIDTVDPSTEIDVYNLVVADFSTYFVGESGVLVHDNTVREPTRAAVPGLVDAAVR